MRFNPKDKKLWFVGRKDFQVKHQGYRIELEEIEHAMLSISGVEEAVALHRNDEGGSRIIGVIASRTYCSPASLRSQLAQFVPKYMVPSQIHVIEKMPKNANGKTDRKQLRDTYFQGGNYE